MVNTTLNAGVETSEINGLFVFLTLLIKISELFLDFC